MKLKALIGAGVAAGALMVSSGIAGAAWNIDGDGFGFVGKGDVQLALDLNNKQLQSAVVSFAVTTTSSQASTWTCDKDSGPQTQERANTTTTSTQGLVSSVARERNQITGFNLTGFSGSPTETEEHEGPAVGSCPTGWTAIDLVEGEVVEGDSVLTVNGVELAVPEPVI